MQKSDITVNIPGGVFNYRVGAIIIDGGEILMVKNTGASFFYTVGGRIQFGETAQEAVAREAFEETGLPLEVDRLAFIHENFFVMDNTGEAYHELCLFFLMKPHSQLRAATQGTFEEVYGSVEYHWLPIHTLKEQNLYPEFFKTQLHNIPSQAVCFCTRGGVTRVIQ